MYQCVITYKRYLWRNIYAYSYTCACSLAFLKMMMMIRFYDPKSTFFESSLKRKLMFAQKAFPPFADVSSDLIFSNFTRIGGLYCIFLNYKCHNHLISESSYNVLPKKQILEHYIGACYVDML